MYTKTVTLTMLWKSTLQVLSINEHIICCNTAKFTFMALHRATTPTAIPGSSRRKHRWAYIQQAAVFDFPLNSSNPAVLQPASPTGIILQDPAYQKVFQ